MSAELEDLIQSKAIQFCESSGDPNGKGSKLPLAARHQHLLVLNLRNLFVLGR